MRTLTLRRRFGAGRGISTWLGAIWFGTRFRPIRFWTRGLRTSIWLRWNRALVSCGRFRRSIGSSRFWRIVRPVILCRCRAIRIWTIVWHRAIGFRSDWPIVFRAIDVRTVIWLSRNTIVWLRLVWPARLHWTIDWRGRNWTVWLRFIRAIGLCRTTGRFWRCRTIRLCRWRAIRLCWVSCARTLIWIWSGLIAGTIPWRVSGRHVGLAGANRTRLVSGLVARLPWPGCVWLVAGTSNGWGCGFPWRSLLHHRTRGCRCSCSWTQLLQLLPL